jgi:hypothetical protein
MEFVRTEFVRVLNLSLSYVSMVFRNRTYCDAVAILFERFNASEIVIRFKIVCRIAPSDRLLWGTLGNQQRRGVIL